jgi:hypothetical protein
MFQLSVKYATNLPTRRPCRLGDKWLQAATRLVCLLPLAAALCGCHTVRESTPPRTATEQLLLSTAADNALAGQRFSWLAGKKTFVEDKYFEGYDKGYAIGLLRERFAASGALLVKAEDKAEVVVEIRSGVLSMDNSERLVGVPAMTVPIPLAGPVTTPEVAFYRCKRSDSVVKIALFAYERPSGHYLQTVKPMLGRAQLRLYKALVFSWQKTDVPELSRPSKPKAARAETPPAPTTK